MTRSSAPTAYDNFSAVERKARAASGQPFRCRPAEKTRLVVVPDFPSLGRLTALRFLEWLQRNPGGVISLPTGKTPEYFIQWTAHYLARWSEKSVSAELAGWGIDPARPPDMRSYRFVQIDEFYPMDPAQANSFSSYARRFYFDGFGLDPRRALLMDTWTVGAPPGGNLGEVFGNDEVDLALRYEQPRGRLEEDRRRAIMAMDQYALDYEERIRALGGIGFFLGGIGPDGHIGFNIRGSGFHGTTRLDNINYETAAAAAADLGGIEVSRHKRVLTIGLATITRNPAATAVIIAAGDSKAGVVRDAVENDPSILYPATALHRLPGSIFFLTRGAARLLTGRKCREIASLREMPAGERERIIIDTASAAGKKLVDLSRDDFERTPAGRILAGRERGLGAACRETAGAIVERIGRGMDNYPGSVFLHTAPHHDDIMLGYLPYVVHLVREPSSRHFFATLTSGFTSVTNGYADRQLENLGHFLDGPAFRDFLAEGYFRPDNAEGRNRDVYQYLDEVAAVHEETRQEAAARRMMRNLVELSGTVARRALRERMESLRRYLRDAYPGRKDPPEVQELKGMIREWEEELLWAHLGFSSEHVFHLRLKFYTGDIFTEKPTWERDVLPFLDLLRRIRPDILVVALDPEGSGPDTHYKVLQVIASGLEAWLAETGREVRVWGYRNVWFRFHPSEANIFVPVSMNSLAIMKSAFDTCFGSQRTASFPSYEHDGPFPELARKIMVEQYDLVKTCLGREFFHLNPVPRLRATRGLNFLREMTGAEFAREARLLRRSMEGGERPLK